MKRFLKDYLGRSICLTDERLDHILEHPEMRNLVSEVEAALIDPELVIESLSDPTASLFYRMLNRPRLGVRWVCVVVKYDQKHPFVLTAYLTDKPKKGVRQWPAE